MNIWDEYAEYGEIVGQVDLDGTETIALINREIAKTRKRARECIGKHRFEIRFYVKRRPALEIAWYACIKRGTL